MQLNNQIKVIIDTNLFISFLIGKRLKKLKDYLVNSNVILIFAEQNILELEIVSKRDKFKKYFTPAQIADLIDFIYTVGQVHKIKKYPELCRDPKDNFLLALAEKGKANYLVTGDKDLLEIVQYKSTKIVPLSEFEELF